MQTSPRPLPPHPNSGCGYISGGTSGLNEDNVSGPGHLCFMTTMQPIIQDGHVLSNCDFVLVGAPQWPFEWSDGLHMAVMQLSTAGEFACFLAEPGKLPFQRHMSGAPCNGW